MILANNFTEVLKEFNSQGVNYLIVGGYAVIFHGYVRTTGDIDIWVEPDSNNKERLVNSIKSLKLGAELIEYMEQLDFTTPFSVKIGDKPLQMDIFNAITGLRFEETFQKSILYQFQDGLEVRFIQLEDLIKNKMLTGRLKDKADVEELQKIRKHRNRN